MKVEISIYSVMNAALYFQAALVLLVFLRNRTEFFTHNSVKIVMLLFFLSGLRMLLPLDPGNAFVIESELVIPAVRRVFRRHIHDGLTVGMVITAVWAAGFWFVLLKELKRWVCEMKI